MLNNTILWMFSQWAFCVLQMKRKNTRLLSSPPYLDAPAFFDRLWSSLVGLVALYRNVAGACWWVWIALESNEIFMLVHHICRRSDHGGSSAASRTWFLTSDQRSCNHAEERCHSEETNLHNVWKSNFEMWSAKEEVTVCMIWLSYSLLSVLILLFYAFVSSKSAKSTEPNILQQYKLLYIISNWQSISMNKYSPDLTML